VRVVGTGAEPRQIGLHDARALEHRRTRTALPVTVAAGHAEEAVGLLEALAVPRGVA